MSNEEETDVGQLWFCLMYITPDLFNNTNEILRIHFRCIKQVYNSGYLFEKY